MSRANLEVPACALHPIQTWRAQRVPIDHLELNEVETLLGGINQKTPAGRRDYTLLVLMFNTGARVQEILNLKVRDVG